ncbi:PspC domain-containing protein [Brachybacterium sp. AOP25-B2-12]|uniref:PspC domain-containing protein n=1 Tax=Brachybacterium sp. AOP25-B2-12 TaxID=3457710 RepID=UPI004033BA21
MNAFFDLIRGIGFRRGPRRLLGGIGGGIAARTGLNVWLVRALLVASFLLPVLGVGAYVLAWALLPWQDTSIPLQRALDGLARGARRS